MPVVVIKSSYCGPPGYGNGGYVAGMLAQHMGGSVEVLLRQPTPLNTELMLTADAADHMTLTLGQTIIAEVTPAQFELEVPAPPAYATAVAAAGSHPGLGSHPVPGCFVCGPQRADGLRIFPGRSPGGECVATDWTPPQALADATGEVLPEFIWAVLDCPGAFTLTEGTLIPVLLGKLSVRIHAPVLAGAPHILTAWLIANEGRKYFTGTALFSAAGELCACARATWIRLKELSILAS